MTSWKKIRVRSRRAIEEALGYAINWRHWDRPEMQTKKLVKLVRKIKVIKNKTKWVEWDIVDTPSLFLFIPVFSSIIIPTMYLLVAITCLGFESINEHLLIRIFTGTIVTTYLLGVLVFITTEKTEKIREHLDDIIDIIETEKDSNILEERITFLMQNYLPKRMVRWLEEE